MGTFYAWKCLEVNLKLCHYNSFPGPGANQKRSKHRFHGYIDGYSLERHGAVIWVKLQGKLCGKENFDSKWRMTLYGWLKVKLLYYIIIK